MPTKVRQSYTGKNVLGFKFPAGDAIATDGKGLPTNATDLENLQQFQIYFGFNATISSIEDIKRTGTTKTNKLYNTLLNSLLYDYNRVSIVCLELASSMCWVPVYDNKEAATGSFSHKLTPERAIYEIEPAEGLLVAVQTKMDLTFSTQLVKNIARLEINKELNELKEVTGNLKKTMSK